MTKVIPKPNTYRAELRDATGAVLGFTNVHHRTEVIRFGSRIFTPAKAKLPPKALPVWVEAAVQWFNVLEMER